MKKLNLERHLNLATYLSGTVRRRLAWTSNVRNARNDGERQELTPETTAVNRQERLARLARLHTDHR